MPKTDSQTEIPTLLKPAQAVRCPLTGKAVFISECRECKHMIEVRQPWCYWAVKCEVPGKSSAVYP